VNGIQHRRRQLRHLSVQPLRFTIAQVPLDVDFELVLASFRFRLFVVSAVTPLDFQLVLAASRCRRFVVDRAGSCSSAGWAAR
jgi:hypothetical protein